MADDMLDRRSLRTRAALHGAFVELLLEQGFEALKIGAVADRANVGRSTFYEHYRTKHDLLRASIVGPFSILADLVAPTVSAGSVTALLRHFRDNQQIARVLLGWPTRPLLGHTLADLIADRLKRHPAGLARVPHEVIARQIADAQLSLVDSWVQGRPHLDLDVAADALKRTAMALASVYTPASSCSSKRLAPQSDH
ncbi:TetR/AcrR family transcriptional regulator [Massilia genomosp. 1]|uniref:TetR family transcriptional regulator n=1 Tax=Massilia genomosp. 1 TaxID=2609280 RepID=A0ABX0MXK2_9BURK|nr:TetR/AcrR family transcriptional regulator [Massilia genomosp. 1]NHZ64595.1 TetR family transcriptional regulator [Massilia genomosp. 1]